MCTYISLFKKPKSNVFILHLPKGYLHYKMITSQNVLSEAQVKNFFIS